MKGCCSCDELQNSVCMGAWQVTCEIGDEVGATIGGVAIYPGASPPSHISTIFKVCTHTRKHAPGGPVERSYDVRETRAALSPRALPLWVV